jgi:hypothetical protein
MIDLPTLEQLASYDPREIIDSPWGRIEAWRAATMMTGSIAPAIQVYDIVRNDAAAAVARIEAIENREANTKALAARLITGMDALATRVDAFEAQYKADAQEAQGQREFEEEPLSLPPDVIETDVPKDDGDQHTPGGELHSLPASEPEDKERELPEPPEADAAGVPLSYGNVPTSYVGGGPRDQVEFEQLPSIEEPPFVPQDRRARRPRMKSPPMGPRAPVAVE